MARKRKKALPPRRKRMNRKSRLKSARHWLRDYEGTHLARAYRKRFGVDWPCAFEELEMLGVAFDPAYVEEVLRGVERDAEAKRKKKAEARAGALSSLGVDQDEHFAYIIGYTAGGLPYGLTWDEYEAEEYDPEALSD